MLVTRGLGGMAPGLVTAGLGSFEEEPAPVVSRDGGGGGWPSFSKRRFEVEDNSKLLAIARREDEEIVAMLDAFLRVIQ